MRQKGIVSFDNAKLSYNQITNQLLGIASRLESGAFQDEVKEQRQRVRWGLLIGLPLFVALAWGAFIFLSPQKNPDGYTCPGFNPIADFKIFVLPFQPIGINKTVTETHRRIKDRLEELSSEEKLNTSCGTTQETDFALNDEIYPDTPEEAETFGNKCNPDLIIWGTTENIDNQVTIRRKFKFLNVGERFTLGKIREAGGEIRLKWSKNLQPLPRVMALTGQIEEILLGIVAFNSGKTDKAIALLSTAETEDPGRYFIKGDLSG